MEDATEYDRYPEQLPRHIFSGRGTGRRFHASIERAAVEMG
jgi:hypothetical protein